MRFKTIQEFTQFLIEEANKIEDELNSELEKNGITEFIKKIRESNFKGDLEEFNVEKKGNNALIHLYEKVLKELDPKRKLQRGVFFNL